MAKNIISILYLVLRCDQGRSRPQCPKEYFHDSLKLFSSLVYDKRVYSIL